MIEVEVVIATDIENEQILETFVMRLKAKIRDVENKGKLLGTPQIFRIGYHWIAYIFYEVK
jgi:hypothetical protein